MSTGASQAFAPFGFAPELARTAALDQNVRTFLADSVARVLAVAARFGVGWAGDLAAWRAELLAMAAAPPQLWAVYHDLVQAMRADDRALVSALATDLLGRLPSPSPAPGGVATLTRVDLGVDLERIAAVVDNDPLNPLHLKAVAPEEVARVERLMREARALLAGVAPELLHEIDVLGRTAFLARGEGVVFGGAASVFLWGAVVLNPVLAPDRVSLVEGLAHETAHALLFGMTLGCDLTTNDPAERYASPLRRDPRPIEGLVHATYVLARMIHALERLRGCRDLTGGERRLVEDKLAANRAKYAGGLRTVEAHAAFTSDGAEVFDACRRAMADG